MRYPFVYWIIVLAVFAFGVALRLCIWHPDTYQPGFDELVYMDFTSQFQKGGIGGFPATVQDYIEKVQISEAVYLPPFRVGYTIPAAILDSVTHIGIYSSLRLISALAASASLLAGFLFARRWLPPLPALSVLAVMACAPLQIHLGQFAFIDPVASLWALLSAACLWESLRQPRHLGWLAGTALTVFALCLSKQETAVFTGISLTVAIAIARPMGWSPAPWRQALALVGAGLLGVITLSIISGGFAPLLQAFSIYQERAKTLPYTILTGDGPWHRYLLEYLLINPLVFLLAVGCAFRSGFTVQRNGYFLVLLGAMWFLMSSIPMGMNIRHTAMWDFPLALLAVHCIASIPFRWRWPLLWPALIVCFVCYTELRLYGTIFRSLYDTDPRFMLRAVRILK